MIQTLYIVRHGIAVDIGEQGVVTDAERMLSPAGRERTRLVSEYLHRLGIRPDVIVSSPYPRAFETAEILNEVLEVGREPRPLDPLRPAGALSDLLNQLSRCPEEAVMLVGHMPDLAMLASMLISGAADLDLTFKKAGVCCLSFWGTFSSGAGSLDWLIQPKQMLRLGTD